MSRYQLSCDEEGYFLKDRFSRQKPLRASFDNAAFLKRLRGAGRKSELVARAVKVTPGLRVLDCTAGLGRDSFVLAYLGCHVTLCERSRVMQCLLQDALDRARDHSVLGPSIARMQLLADDALKVLSESNTLFDVVYLDPMFPDKQGSAAVKGGMQYLQRFIGPDPDTKRLLTAALRSECDRVVLKRPAYGGDIPDFSESPIHVFKNRNTRYEVYAPVSSAGVVSA